MIIKYIYIYMHICIYLHMSRVRARTLMMVTRPFISTMACRTISSPLRHVRPRAACCAVQGSECRVQGAGCRVQGSGFRVSGTSGRAPPGGRFFHY